MVRFINKVTGNEMWVADERAEEYRAAGHKPVDAAPDTKNKQKPKRPARKTKK